jgi:predicted enzyme related to lactoylglutathione lyase
MIMPNTQGAVSYIEMGSGDAEKTVGFFSSLFHWPFNPTSAGGGWFDAPGGKIGVHGGDPDGGMTPYFRVADIEAAAEQVRKLGGEADVIADEAGFGRFCNCRDPQGMRFGLHQLT